MTETSACSGRLQQDGTSAGGRKSLLAWLFIAGLGLAAVGLVTVVTSKYGPGLTRDSVQYISGAVSLVSGNGLTSYTGEPITLWPPLFSALLASLGLAGVEPVSAARCVNAAAFGLIVSLSAWLFLGHVRSRVLAVTGSVSVLVSAPLVRVCSIALSEPIFIVLCIAFYIIALRYMKSGAPSLLFLLSAITALGCLQRYIGLSLVLAGVALILVRGDTGLLPTLRRAFLFGGISTVPLALWLLRNHWVSSTLTGPRRGFATEPMQTLGHALVTMVSILRVIGGWCSPATDISIKSIRFGIAALGAILALKAFANIRKVGRMRQLLHPLAVFWAAYMMALFSAKLVDSSLRDLERFMLPVYVPTLLIGFKLADSLPGREKRSSCVLRSHRLVLALCMVWLVLVPGRNLIELVSTCVQSGVEGYGTTEWRESALVDWLRRNPLSGRIYTNAPEAMYILTGIRAEKGPSNSAINDSDERANASDTSIYLLCFAPRDRAVPCDFAYIRHLFELRPIVTLSDGVVYLLLRRSPEASAREPTN